METADITALTGAFDPAVLLTTFVGLAAFILGGLAVRVGIAVAKGTVKKVAHKVGGGL